MECIKHVKTDLSWIFLNIPLEGVGEKHRFACKTISSWEMAPSSENQAETTVLLSLGVLGESGAGESGRESSGCGAAPRCHLFLSWLSAATQCWFCGIAGGCPSLIQAPGSAGGTSPSHETARGRGLCSTPHSYPHSKSYTFSVTPQGVQWQENMDHDQPLPLLGQFYFGVPLPLY